MTSSITIPNVRRKSGLLDTVFIMSAESDLESSMDSVQIEQKSYEMPPREGFSVAQFLTVTDIDRSARWYKKVFDATFVQ